MNGDNPLVVQSDRTVLLEVQHPRYEEARDRLASFAELEKSPEHVHFYRITPVSIWNAAALGEPVADILEWLQGSARFPVPPEVVQQVETWYRRFGLLRMVRNGDELLLESDDEETLQGLVADQRVAGLVSVGDARVAVDPDQRGAVKQALIRLGYPVEDRAGYRDGAPLEFALSGVDGEGRAFSLREYQRAAAEAFHKGGSESGGCGVVVLPCGAGKTVIGMAVMELLQTKTLVLTTNTVAVRQWRRELVEKTTLTGEEVGEYTGENKDVRPVTIATYQILTHRKKKLEAFAHFGLFDREDWGLIVYDEVHLLPAPVFRATAGIQARRRLGLTATLVREDGKESDVFSLIGPKRFELPWKQLERQGWLASARCIEVRVEMGEGRREGYRSAGARQQFQIACNNERKADVLGRLLEHHRDDRVLVIGQFLEQLHGLAAVFGMPLITGRTPTGERERLYGAFREGELSALMVSKVGNFAVDLPDANVAVQVSGTFGSRQEEAQRLGRILRPKRDGGAALFYSLVTEDSREQEFAARRQLFLTEQGYTYEIVPAASLHPAGISRNGSETEK